MPYFQRARINMTQSQIQPSGVFNARILDAFSDIPRERFLPKEKQTLAYADQDLSFQNAGRFLLKPQVHARLLEFAAPEKEDVVLDIGCMTGYSSVLLSRLCETVVALEEEREALDLAQDLWKDMTESNIIPVNGLLYKGVPEHAPYSLIILNGSVSKVPQILLDQLDNNGRLLTVQVATDAKFGQAVMVSKTGSVRFLFDAYAPPLPGFSQKYPFLF